jgi:hypothetical protein
MAAKVDAMSDPDTGDIEGLRPQEATDPDERGEDEFTDPPDDWAAADRFGTTPREQREGEPLSLRLTEEQPEDAPPEPEQPAADADPDDLQVVTADDLERRGQRP